MALELAIGGRQTQSFCSLTEANTHIALLGADITLWTNASTAQKEWCLALAAQLMALFPWRGRKAYCGQALCFPRTVQDNVHSYPLEIKQAQAHIAFNVVFRALQSIANSPVGDGAIDPARATQVSLGGILGVHFSMEKSAAGTLLDRLAASMQLPIYLSILRWTSQIRGGTVGDATEETCSTTTTSTSTTSTTTTSLTTTSTTTTT